MAFEIGTTIGGYEFIDIIDNSKTGVAYKVRNVRFGRLEMLRILPRNTQGDQERVERFLREVKVHSRLSHPNIITFYNATEIEGQFVMTMELVEGTPLAWRLETSPVPCLEAIDYMRQVLSALGYAHKQGIVHRDVTPANILVTTDNRAMLGGFGMAKAATDPNLTQAGTAVGVAQYISPEQVKGVDSLDGRSDIYSLGVVLYEAITKKVPFNASSQFEVMLAHVNTVPMPPSFINPDIPPELDKVIVTALEKEPAQRFQTAEEFSEALSEVAQAIQRKNENSSVKPAPISTPRAEPPRVISHPGATPVSVAAAGRTDRPQWMSVPPMVAAGRKMSVSQFGQALAREWTFMELALGGVVTTVILTLVFFALMTMTGAQAFRGH